MKYTHIRLAEHQIFHRISIVSMKSRAGHNSIFKTFKTNRDLIKYAFNDENETRDRMRGGGKNANSTKQRRRERERTCCNNSTMKNTRN